MLMWSCDPRLPLVVFGIANFGLVSCVKPPELKPIANSSAADPQSPGSISINEVVRRVKCEVRDAIGFRQGLEYNWLNKWTVTADLSLSVNDNSQISPGLVLSHQFLAGNIAQSITNFPQSSSLGLGGQASTTASRTEIVSFTMAVKEIRDEFLQKAGRGFAYKFNADFYYNGCAPYGDIPIDLTGRLGLKEWVDSALGPIEARAGYAGHERALLKEGDHKQAKGPTGGSPPSPSPAAIKSLMNLAPATGAAIDSELASPNFYRSSKDTPPPDKIRSVVAEILLVQQKELGLQPQFTTVQQLTDLMKAGVPLSKEEKGNFQAAQKKLQELAVSQRTLLQHLTDLLQDLERNKATCSCDQTIKALDQQRQRLASAIPKPPSRPPRPSLDPPIDAISHQVQFIVVYNASINPTWTMLNFKGPSPTTGSFFSATNTNTHTLTIVMGEPNSPAANNSRSTLTLGNALTSQIAPMAPPTSPLFQ